MCVARARDWKGGVMTMRGGEVQRPEKRSALRAHGMGRIGFLLRAGGGWGDRENGALAEKVGG